MEAIASTYLFYQLPGELGLPSGFLYAGSPSVVSSLWTVSDISTAFLIAKFYENLQNESSVAVALDHAQLWLRDATGDELKQWMEEKQFPLNRTLKISLLRQFNHNPQPFQSPFYWAAFCAADVFIHIVIGLFFGSIAWLFVKIFRFNDSDGGTLQE